MRSIKSETIYKKVLRFFGNHNIDTTCQFIISLSGGRDSMALLTIFMELVKDDVIQKLRVVYFNHQVRPESNDEEIYIRKLLKELNLKHEIIRLDISGSESNFEKNAREARYAHFEATMHSNDLCCFGHHLDDSFEWSMMRMFRAGENDFLRGIPQVRGKFLRPLSDVSRDEINTFCQNHNIQFCEDASNSNSIADRNFVRNEITPLIKKRFPNYLNFYREHRHQFIIRENVFESSAVNIVDTNRFCITYVEQNLSFYDLDILKDVIKKFSHSHRGSLMREINKLISAFNSGKTGPMLFSGNVLVWLNRPFLVIYNQSTHFPVMEIDGLELFKDKQSFVEYLKSQRKTSPLIKINKTNEDFQRKLKKRKIPVIIDSYFDHDSIYSIGTVFSALPD